MVTTQFDSTKASVIVLIECNGDQATGITATALRTLATNSSHACYELTVALGGL